MTNEETTKGNGSRTASLIDLERAAELAVRESAELARLCQAKALDEDDVDLDQIEECADEVASWADHVATNVANGAPAWAALDARRNVGSAWADLFDHATPVLNRLGLLDPPQDGCQSGWQGRYPEAPTRAAGTNSDGPKESAPSTPPVPKQRRRHRLNPLGADGVTPASQLGLDWAKTTERIAAMFRGRMRKQGYMIHDATEEPAWDIVASRFGKTKRVHVLQPVADEDIASGVEDYRHVLEHAALPLPPEPASDEARQAMAGVGRGAVKALLWKADHPDAGVGLFWIGHFDLDPYVKPIMEYLRSEGVEALVLPPTYAVGTLAAR